MTMGVAMQMQWQLRQLMQKHGIAPEPCIVPLTVPVAHPMTLDGLASTTDLDLDRVHCSGNMNPAQVAGQIERRSL